MSAFDAAAAGEGSRRGVSGGGGGGGSGEDSLVTVLSQRLWTLAQALEKVEKIVQGVGSAADSPALRARLAAAEAKASALWSEIDAGARKLRVAAASGGGDRAAVERFQGEGCGLLARSSRSDAALARRAKQQAGQDAKQDSDSRASLYLL